MDLKKVIREVPNYPHEGIRFYDLTTLWNNKEAYAYTTNQFIERYKGKGITKVVAAESRGFIVGAPIAVGIGASFVPVRKKGKLPSRTISESYQLEYGTDTLFIHEDAITKDDKVLIVDDLLATGGTIEAIIKLVRKLQGNIYEACFLVDLTFLPGRKILEKHQVPMYNLISYDSE